MGSVEKSSAGAHVAPGAPEAPRTGGSPSASGARRLVTLPIRGYKTAISPLLGERCKYYPSCSEYAVGSIERYGVMKGTVLAAWRLMRCNPWSHGGVDHPEDQRLFRS